MFRCYSYTIIRESTAQEHNTHTPITANNIYSHTTTVLTTHRCILMDYFNNCNFSKHKLMRSLMMV